jgi:hypothetical protein
MARAKFFRHSKALTGRGVAHVAHVDLEATGFKVINL